MARQGPRMRTGNIGDGVVGEEARTREAQQDADTKFREAMARAGYREHISTKEGTEFPRFTPAQPMHFAGRSSMADF